ncbi:MAG: type II toxin-antitoxin system RelE/ParE family toxin [Saprospiraceae bacterium]
MLYYQNGDGSKLPFEYLKKINRILDQLDAVTTVADLLEMGQGIHKLTGEMSEFWSIKISANYRLIFRFEKGDLFDIDYIDYH